MSGHRGEVAAETGGHTQSTVTRARQLVHTLRPDRHEIVDMVCLLGLGLLAMWGFATTWTGWWFLVVGALGLLLGGFIAHVALRLGQPLAVVALLVVLVFFLGGGPIALAWGGGSAIPAPQTLRDLADALVHGWKDLLTTLPPVDATGPLLVLPYVLGLVAGALGLTLARRFPTGAWAALAPVGLLVSVIVLGVERPVSWAQGGAFAVLLLVWLVLRSDRGVDSAQGRGTWLRVGTSTVLLALAAAVATPLAGPVLADARREVLRPHVTPPLDVGQYPSPLASFRRNTKQAKPSRTNVHDKVLFTVKGLADGTRVRFAALDSYDGSVWGASNDGSPGDLDDTYQRVSGTIDNPVRGHRSVTATVTMAPAYSGVWLPLAGALRHLEFEGDAASRQQDFRYNIAAETGLVPPAGLRAGDSYTFTAELPDTTLAKDLALASGSVAVRANTDFVATTALTTWAPPGGTPMERLLKVAEHLRNEGRYSDGDGKDAALYHPGHFVKRLDEEFLNAPQIVGNDEQYAAAMALAANRIGVPARVVVGAKVDHGEVRGRDVRAWVELLAADGSWRIFDRDRFMDPAKRPPLKSPPQSQSQRKGLVVPPAAPVPPPSSLGDPTDTELRAHKRSSPSHLGLPSWVWTVVLWTMLPLSVLVALAGAIIGAKSWRRRRRRTAARVSSRFVGGWHELLDRATDLGTRISHSGTRREQARALGWEPALALSGQVDSHVFGPGEPTDSDAESYWADLEVQLRAWARERSRWQRLRAALSLRSFRSHRPVPVLRRKRS